MDLALTVSPPRVHQDAGDEDGRTAERAVVCEASRRAAAERRASVVGPRQAERVAVGMAVDEGKRQRVALVVRHR